MSIWFEGSNEIKCTFKKVQDSFENYGEHYVKVIGYMLGLTSVELVNQGDDFVILKTNEGIMKRTNISKISENNSLVIEFDEEYQAGNSLGVYSHIMDEFTPVKNKVVHRLVITRVKTKGLLGFFYRRFAKSNIGNALINSCKTYFEND